MNLEAVVRELLRRGHRVTAAERTWNGGVVVGFEIMGPGDPPTWLKAVQAPTLDPDAVERSLRAWKDSVIRDLAEDRASPIVRRMIAEHGQDRVFRALGMRADA